MPRSGDCTTHRTCDLCRRETGTCRQPQHGQIHRVSKAHRDLCVGGQPCGGHRRCGRPRASTRAPNLGCCTTCRAFTTCTPKPKTDASPNGSFSMPSTNTTRTSSCWWPTPGRCKGQLFLDPSEFGSWASPAWCCSTTCTPRDRHGRSFTPRPSDSRRTSTCRCVSNALRQSLQLDHRLVTPPRRPQGVRSHPTRPGLGKQACTPAAPRAPEHARTAVPLAADERHAFRMAVPRSTKDLAFGTRRHGQRRSHATGRSGRAHGPNQTDSPQRSQPLVTPATARAGMAQRIQCGGCWGLGSSFL